MEHLQRCSSCALHPDLAPPPGVRELAMLSSQTFAPGSCCSSFASATQSPLCTYAVTGTPAGCQGSEHLSCEAGSMHSCVLCGGPNSLHFFKVSTRTARLFSFRPKAASALRLRESSVAYAMMMMIKVGEWYAAGLPAARYTARVCTNNIVQLNKQFTDC